MVGLKERIIPVEDSMETLIELLVSPLLPFKSTSHLNPSVFQQEDLAKQMHAVVLLYNFYHRKKFSEIEFLSFQSLCKSSAIANPAIISYFQFMQQKQSIEKISTISSSDDLSIVEKAVINACDIAVCLYDAFSGDNNGEMRVFDSWPVERIGVFLVDKKREKCLIEKDVLVKGVWSLVEREIERKKGINNNDDDNNGVLNESFDEALESLAVSEVQSKTGIESSDLRTRYRHLTYSLNKEKSSTRVYIMEYTKQPSKTALIEIPIDFIIDRLKGPVINTESRPEATSVASYYLLLPYIEIISDWLKTPEDSHNSQIKQEKINQKIPMEIDIEKSQISDNNSDGSSRIPMEIEKDQKNVKNQTSNGPQKMQIERMKNKFQNQTFIGSKKEAMEIEKKQTDTKNQAFNESQKTLMEIERTQNNAQNKKSIIRSQKAPMESEKIQNIVKNRNSSGSQKDAMELEKTPRNLKSQTCNESQNVPMEIEKTRNIVRNETSNVSLKMKGINIDNKRKHVGPSYKKVKEIGISKYQSRDGMTFNSSVSKEVVKPFCNEMTPSDESPITKSVVFDKSDLESCFQVAIKKRDELCKKHRLLEDEIAQCEMDIQTMICEGEMTPKVESILAKWENPDSNEGSQSQIKKKLKLKSSCQELDDVCRENNLILPRYNVLPCIPDGMYTASATLRGPDFEFTVGTDLKKSPKEAREQAAIRLLEKLHDIVQD